MANPCGYARVRHWKAIGSTRRTGLGLLYGRRQLDALQPSPATSSPSVPSPAPRPGSSSGAAQRQLARRCMGYCRRSSWSTWPLAPDSDIDDAGVRTVGGTTQATSILRGRAPGRRRQICSCGVVWLISSSDESVGEEATPGLWTPRHLKANREARPPPTSAAATLRPDPDGRV